jgi:hypothetical protein
MIDPAREDVIVEGASTAFEPSGNAGSCWFKKFELDGAAGLLLNDDRPRPNPATADDLADFDFYDVASAKFTVDR